MVLLKKLGSREGAIEIHGFGSMSKRTHFFWGGGFLNLTFKFRDMHAGFLTSRCLGARHPHAARIPGSL
jgi:hypothetical protein